MSQRQDRRTKALAYLDLGGRGLEIGPSYDPLVPKSSGARIETVDHAGRAELIEKFRGHGVPPDKVARIEEVDHIWTGGSLVDLIGERSAFDYIIASHVVEHSVDLIRFLQDCQALLRAGGRLSLVIPDKRYCFDSFQPLTSVGSVVDAHLAGARFHPPGSLLDHRAYASVRGPGVIAWDRATTTPITLQFDDLRAGREILEEARRQEGYLDVHRWKFTPTSFRLLLRDLRELGYHELGEVGGFDTDGFEFFVCLAPSAAPEPTEDRLTLLRRVEAELCADAEPAAGDAVDQAVEAVEAEPGVQEWPGFCPICERQVVFHAYGPWHRDQLVCTTCGSLPRQRALLLVLSLVKPDWRRARLWDVAPTGPGSAKLRRECPAYLGTHYWADVPPGAMVNGVRCEDLERPTLDDASIDVIVSSDVFEHVVDIDAALGQVARVLAPDGLHVWTAPQQPGLARSRVRVRRGPDGLEYLLPVEYHQDPVADEGALVTFDWGKDLPARVEAASGMSTVVYRIESRAHGLLGEYSEVFVSHRGLGNPVAELQRREVAAAIEVERMGAALLTCEQTLTGVLTSRSWRVTSPLRALRRAVRIPRA